MSHNFIFGVSLLILLQAEEMQPKEQFDENHEEVEVSEKAIAQIRALPYGKHLTRKELQNLAQLLEREQQYDTIMASRLKEIEETFKEKIPEKAYNNLVQFEKLHEKLRLKNDRVRAMRSVLKRLLIPVNEFANNFEESKRKEAAERQENEPSTHNRFFPRTDHKDAISTIPKSTRPEDKSYDIEPGQTIKDILSQPFDVEVLLTDSGDSESGEKKKRLRKRFRFETWKSNANKNRTSKESIRVSLLDVMGTSIIGTPAIELPPHNYRGKLVDLKLGQAEKWRVKFENYFYLSPLDKPNEETLRLRNEAFLKLSSFFLSDLKELEVEQGNMERIMSKALGKAVDLDHKEIIYKSYGIPKGKSGKAPLQPYLFDKE